MKSVKYLIVGAGVTGLSFANFINSEDYIIIESEDKVGGYCKTTYYKDYIWDYAGHFFHFKTNKMKNYFKNIIDENEIIFSEKNTKIFYNNTFVDFPFQKNIHQLEKKEFIDCLYDLFNKKNIEVNNFKEMIYSKFGKSIANKFLIPYNEKLYACDLNILDKEAMGRFFPYATEIEIINNFKNKNNNSYNNQFLYPKKGAQYFVDLLKENCKQENIYLNEKLVNIDYKNKLAKTNKRDIKYEYLISSISIKELINILNIDINTKEITGNKVLVFNIGFDSKGIEDIHWMYFPEKKYNFYRVGFYNNILKTEKMSIYVEVGVKENQNIDLQEEYKKVICGLKECGIINNQKVVGYESIIMQPAYAHISKKSEVLVNDLIESLKIENIYCLGRYGQWKYCSIEDSMIDSYDLANKMNKLL